MHIKKLTDASVLKRGELLIPEMLEPLS